MPFLKESGICVIVLLLLSCHPANAQWNYDSPFPEPLDKGADTVFVTFIGDVMMHHIQDTLHFHPPTDMPDMPQTAE